LECHPPVAAGTPSPDPPPDEILLDFRIPAKFKAVKPLNNRNS